MVPDEHVPTKGAMRPQLPHSPWIRHRSSAPISHRRTWRPSVTFQRKCRTTREAATSSELCHS